MCLCILAERRRNNVIVVDTTLVLVSHIVWPVVTDYYVIIHELQNVYFFRLCFAESTSHDIINNYLGPRIMF